MKNKSTHQISYAIGYRRGKAKCKAECKENKLIDKACEWLWEHFYDHPHIKSFVCTESFGDSEEMIECFKKAMAK